MLSLLLLDKEDLFVIKYRDSRKTYTVSVKITPNIHHPQVPLLAPTSAFVQPKELAGPVKYQILRYTLHQLQ